MAFALIVPTARAEEDPRPDHDHDNGHDSGSEQHCVYRSLSRDEHRRDASDVAQQRWGQSPDCPRFLLGSCTFLRRGLLLPAIDRVIRVLFLGMSTGEPQHDPAVLIDISHPPYVALPFASVSVGADRKVHDRAQRARSARFVRLESQVAPVVEQKADVARYSLVTLSRQRRVWGSRGGTAGDRRSPRLLYPSKVRMRGLEPPRGCPHTDLNRARLPIPPHPRGGTV
jgi:hypothetical protein